MASRPYVIVPTRPRDVNYLMPQDDKSLEIQAQK